MFARSLKNKQENSDRKVKEEKDKETMERIWLKNDMGMKVSVITLGATVTHLYVPCHSTGAESDEKECEKSRDEVVDVILGYDDLNVFHENTPYLGCIVGSFSISMIGCLLLLIVC